MKHKSLLSIIFIFNICLSQVGINNTNPNATLDITASNTSTPQNTDGLLIPRVSNFPATNPTSAQNSMLIYLTNNVGGNTPGFYYWNNNSTTWEKIGYSNNSWNLNGNTGTDPSVNFIGTTDNTDFSIRANDEIQWKITPKGQITPINNKGTIKIGFNAGESDNAYTNTLLNTNIYVGYFAGINASGGNNNIAIGNKAFFKNLTGFGNIAIGAESLNDNNNGCYNLALGARALYNNTTGDDNVSIGAFSLNNNTTGRHNTALGNRSLNNNTSGIENVSIGMYSSVSNNTGLNNVTIGFSSNSSNSDGYNNVIIGHYAGSGYDNSHGNVIIGKNAMSNSNSATLSTGNQNTIIGLGAGSGYTTNLSGNVLLGYQAGSGINQSNKLYIENSSSSSPLIYGEFDNDMIRINGTLQIGKLNLTGYVFPTTRGNNGEVMVTDANGNLTWQNITGSSPFTKTGTTIRPTNVGDDLSFDSSDSSITFATTSTSAPPMINMFSSGSTNYERMVIAHSETSPNYGLKYTDIGDYFSIVGAGNEMIRLNTIGANPLTVNGTATFGNSGNQYTLPSTDGQKGNVLTTDGSGNVNWSGTMTKNITSTGFVFGNFTITDTIYTLKVLNTITSITIPDATTQTGRIIVLIGTNGITTKNFNITNGNVYDVVTNSNITSISANQRFTIQSDGTNWLVISN